MVILTEPPSSKYPESLPGIPENYNFEISKILRTIEKANARKITLQFPDGLLAYAPLIIDCIQSHFTQTDCIILNDVVYGACCVDDQTIKSDLVIHFGHSCLIPITEMETRVLYIFVDIKIDIDHLYQLITENFTGTVALIGTIQFVSAVNKLNRLVQGRRKEAYCCEKDTHGCCLQTTIPQVKPLSPGEVLGCTSPVISGAQNVIYIGDGRFHLESAMIRNPSLNFYKYCPFTRKITQEFYEFNKMVAIRQTEIRKAMDGKSFGVILGSLGRQGNKKIFNNVIKALEKMGKYKIYKIVVDEINQRILDKYSFVDAFVQISCPRLSIDWGACYHKPLLSPFELFYKEEYCMDYYSNEGQAPWKNYNNDYQIEEK